jgi:4-amino-4-deoxy-L-arabinose transferase-like glycosyltransferase
MFHQKATLTRASAWRELLPIYIGHVRIGSVAMWLVWLLPVFASLFLRPIFPLDETRYMSVAWTMWRDGEFIVPHLQGLIYTHKPPLLFWLINAGWALFGINEWWPRLLQPAFACGSLFLLDKIATVVWPDRQRVAILAPMLFAGTWFTALYTPALMFDMMVVFFTLVTYLGIVSPRIRWSYVGVGLALGLLAKGPVIFVYTLPVLVAAPMWRARPGSGWGRWYGTLALTVGLSLVPVLIWLGFAWLRSGSDFLEEAMWTQTVDRLHGQLGHARPAWWYLVRLPVLCMPWLAWPPVWRMLRARTGDSGSRFLLAAAVVSLLILSLVGSKQVHYLLPALALASLGMARLLAEAAPRRGDNLPTAGVLVIVAIALGMIVLGVAGDGLPTWTRQFDLAWPILLLVTAVGSILLSPADIEARAAVQLLLTSVLALVLIAGPVRAAREVYGLTAAAQEVAALQQSGADVAYLDNYHGEFDYLGRLQRDIAKVDAATAPAWVQSHPQGVLVTRRKHLVGETLPEPAYTQPYRSGRLDIYLAGDLSCADLTYVD